MIVVKHFMNDRTEKTPKWTDLEEFLNKYDLGGWSDPLAPGKPHATILEMKAYPTGPYHNVIVVLNIPEIASGKPV